MFLSILDTFMTIVLGVLLAKVIQIMSNSFELIFNKLKIDTDIWGGEKNE